MSVKSELLLNTQNSFQTHAQRGANIVMRGGKRKSRRKKGGDGETVVVENGKHKVVKKKNLLQQIGEAAYKKIRFSGDIGEDGECKQTGLYGSQCKPGLWCSPVEEYKRDEKGEYIWDENGYAVENPRFERTRKFQKNGNCKPIRKTELFTRGGKRKSKRTKRMARKSRRKSRKSRRNQRGGRGRTITYANLDFMANNRLGKMVPHGDAYTNCNTQTGGGYGFTKEGASASETFKGGYPVFTKYEKSNQCGGKRRRRRKSRKSRKSKRKSRRKSRKSRRKRRKSRRRRKRRAGSPPDGSFPQYGGSSHTYGSPVAVGSKPWATAPLGIQANKPSCYDNYNHYKGL